MTTTRTALLTLAALLAAGGALAMGQGDDEDHGPGEARPGMQDDRGPGGPGMEGGMGHGGGMEALEDQKEALGLSAEQVTKLKALRSSAHKDEMKKAHRQMRDLMAKLEDQVDDKASDKDIAATLASLKTLHEAQMDQMKAMREKAEAILTPTQQAKLLLKRGKGMHGGRMGKGRMGRMGGDEKPGDK